MPSSPCWTHTPTGVFGTGTGGCVVGLDPGDEPLALRP
ncbi:MAG: hypothetical protein JWR83_3689 [Aeromicrobium sp.]|nr:hypothetical protein [Aeromicrobium sp.]